MTCKICFPQNDDDEHWTYSLGCTNWAAISDDDDDDDDADWCDDDDDDDDHYDDADDENAV